MQLSLQRNMGVHRMMLCLGILLLMLSMPAFAKERYWIQLMPSNQSWLRVITEEEKCPSIIMDGITRQMRIHTQKGSAMQITSCKLHIPKGVNKIDIYGDHLTIPNEYKKILIIGDTGCRIKGSYSQDCKNDWPFAKVATLGVQHKPDLIIHVGDYHYREVCTSASCMNENTGDNWKAWNDDFFIPAGELLSVAPWVMVRGNHETCKRGGNGWFNFFDYRKKCYKHSKPYAIDLSSDLRLIVADSGVYNLLPEVINKINDLSQGKRSWLFTHRPFWVDKVNGIDYEHKPSELAANISTIFSGHIHIFQLSEIAGKMQVISGNSGSALYPIEKFSKENSKGDFGFIIMDKQEDKSWQLNAFNVENKIIASHIIK